MKLNRLISLNLLSLSSLSKFNSNTSSFITRSFYSTFSPSISTFSSPFVTSTRKFSIMSDEVKAAEIAASTDPAINPFAPTFFDKLVSKEIPARIVYEDDLALAFHDISPQAPVHIIIIPKNKNGLNRLSSAKEEHKEILGHLLLTAQKVAAQENLIQDGFRIVINDGKNGAQSVYHLHIHLLGGRQMTWPPG